jgi:hypothetical protein
LILQRVFHLGLGDVSGEGDLIVATECSDLASEKLGCLGRRVRRTLTGCIRRIVAKKRDWINGDI